VKILRTRTGSNTAVGRSTTQFIWSIEHIKGRKSRAWWLIPIILTTQKSDVGRIVVQGQPGQKVRGNASLPIKTG
jgi:hypothetical protein